MIVKNVFSFNTFVFIIPQTKVPWSQVLFLLPMLPEADWSPLSCVRALKGQLRRWIWGTRGPSVTPSVRGEPTACRDCRVTTVGFYVYVMGIQNMANLCFHCHSQWVMCFRTKLRKEFQTCYQIHPSITENCLSYKHLPWTCSGIKVHSKPLWILPFVVATEGIFLSAGDMAWWGQKLSVVKEKGWRLEESLPDEAIPWSFYSSLSSSK